jgi:hypothetical protein
MIGGWMMLLTFLACMDRLVLSGTIFDNGMLCYSLSEIPYALVSNSNLQRTKSRLLCF